MGTFRPNAGTDQLSALQRRPKLIEVMASERNIDPAQFLQALKATVVPAGISNEQLSAFLMVAQRYQLDPFLKEIYAFPTKGGGIMPMVSIDGWTSIVNRQPTFDGVELIENFGSDGKIISLTCKMYRKDRHMPTVMTEYLAECQRPTDPWRNQPIRMLRHRAFIQAARYCFSITGISDPEDVARMQESGEVSSTRIIEGHTAFTPTQQENEEMMAELGWDENKKQMCRDTYQGREVEQHAYLSEQVRKYRDAVAQPTEEAVAALPEPVEAEPLLELQPEPDPVPVRQSRRATTTQKPADEPYGGAY